MSDQLDSVEHKKLLEKNDHHVLDARGLLCPEPVMLLHKLIRKIEGGEIIKMTASDSSTERDVPRFCEFLRHSLLLTYNDSGSYTYWVRKREE
jgi:tRNA 2-thiouridine synthesizing protein A